MNRSSSSRFIRTLIKTVLVILIAAIVLFLCVLLADEVSSFNTLLQQYQITLFVARLVVYTLMLFLIYRVYPYLSASKIEARQRLFRILLIFILMLGVCEYSNNFLL